MVDYKTTLNLPYTTFDMRADLTKKEPFILTRWNEANLYAQIRKAKRGKKHFILHDGPIYANGDIHLGHALNRILKDIVVKAKGFSGYDSPFVPGWDCHGLPIEQKVEQKIGKAGDKISPLQFRAECRKYARQQVDKQMTDFIRLGVVADWVNPYLTMDFLIEANTIRCLGKIIENGYLIQGKKPVNWCIDCGSALAEAEIEYHDKTSLSIDVKFNIVDEPAILDKFNTVDGKGKISVVIWTTTPWTLPANRAVALNPELEYSLIQVETNTPERLIIATDLVNSVMDRAGIKNFTKIGTCYGQQLEFLNLKHPFYDFTIPIVLSDHVTIDAGTGAVHTAPGHGQEDYIVGQKYNLETASPVGPDGIFLEGTKFFENEHVFKVNESILKLLQEHDNLLNFENYVHSYPHCWRHKTPIIYRATAQWFISMEIHNLREMAMGQVKEVKWIPSWGQNRMLTMLENRPDWCISRQRFWGIPIPLFIHSKTYALHPNTLKLLEEVAKIVEQKGVQSWWDLDKKILLGEDAEEYEKVTDILDVWFDSGATHITVFQSHPSLHDLKPNLYLEGSDQYRGWFMSSLMIACAANNNRPYNEVLTHGFTVDIHGHKMSKSLGNGIEPQDVVNKLGADILRLWVASTEFTREMTLSDEILKRCSDIYRRIRNTARFLLANLNGFNPEKDLLKIEEMVALDRFAVAHANEVQTEIQNAYENYNLNIVVQQIMQFCSVEMGSFYFEIIKDRLYTAKFGSFAYRSCQTALYHIMQALVRWCAPILSFTADEIWQAMPGEHSEFVFTEEWYQCLFPLPKNEILDKNFWIKMKTVRDEVNKVLENARNNKLIGKALEAEITLYVKPKLFEELAKLSGELRFVTLTSKAELVAADEKPEEAFPTDNDELWISIKKTTLPKCARCWHHTNDIGTVKAHETICARCVTNIEGDGEVRKYA